MQNIYQQNTYLQLPLNFNLYNLYDQQKLINVAGTVTKTPGFVSNLNKSNDSRYLYHIGSVLQICAVL